MKKIIPLLFLICFIFVGCTDKFHYRDKVRVKSGFYKGLEGTITGEDIYGYHIDIYYTVEGKHLEKIED